ncbi:uncharacterized protein [Antedon mediterranea]|uniref:uncharacterized protein n=1 Tax=Antedon mediterranea TaxID=105859 RepID=UPI003AF47BD4
MDVWGASNNHKAYIKKKTSFERMPDWQTNIIEETNYTREGCFDDNFSELSEMEVIFKSGLTDQEFKTVSVTAEEDDIWSSVGLSPDRMFGKKKLNKQEIDNERDYVNIPVAKKNSKCNKTSLSETDINYENEDLKLPPAIPRRQKRRSKVDGDRHIYEEIPFEDDDYEYTDVSDKFGNSTEIASDDDNDDVYELYGFEEETSKGNCKSVISEDVECLYAVVHKRAKTSCLNGTDKQSTNQNKVTNENSENGFLTANRNSCNNIEYSVHLFNGLSSPSNEMDKKDDYVTEKENYEENLYDLIPNDFIENLKQEAHNLDGNNQKESPKSNKSVVLPGASCRGGSVKKPKKAHSEGKHFSRGGSTTRNKLSVWYIEVSY